MKRLVLMVAVVACGALATSSCDDDGGGGGGGVFTDGGRADGAILGDGSLFNFDASILGDGGIVGLQFVGSCTDTAAGTCYDSSVDPSIAGAFATMFLTQFIAGSQTACTDDGGTWATTRCATAGRLGTCTVDRTVGADAGFGIPILTEFRYYGAFGTAADAEADCSSEVDATWTAN